MKNSPVEGMTHTEVSGGGYLVGAQGLNGLSFKQDLYINVVVMVVNELLWDVIREMKF